MSWEGITGSGMGLPLPVYDLVELLLIDSPSFCRGFGRRVDSEGRRAGESFGVSSRWFWLWAG